MTIYKYYVSILVKWPVKYGKVIKERDDQHEYLIFDSPELIKTEQQILDIRHGCLRQAIAKYAEPLIEVAILGFTLLDTIETDGEQKC